MMISRSKLKIRKMPMEVKIIVMTTQRILMVWRIYATIQMLLRQVMVIKKTLLITALIEVLEHNFFAIVLTHILRWDWMMWGVEYRLVAFFKSSYDPQIWILIPIVTWLLRDDGINLYSMTSMISMCDVC